MAEPIHTGVQRIDDTLVLHSVRNERDAQRFADFNAAVNGADQGATCAALLHHHPTIAWDEFVLVEDEARGEVVSTTCSIPGRLQLEGVTLRAAMLEMVVTHPDYRRRGLVRRQIDHFHGRAAAKAVDLCIIEGIPYYYRQFGYAYALDHWATDVLPTALIPDTPIPPAIHVRRAATADIPALAALHRDSLGALPLHAARSAADWVYLLDAAQYPICVVEGGGTTNALGYICAWRSADHATLTIAECGFADAAAALAVLQWCKPMASILQLGWPEQGMLLQVGRGLGSHPHTGDQWLIRIPDWMRLLQKFGPIWTARLARAGYHQLTTELTINLFRQAYRLHFVDGTLAGVDALGFVDASMGAEGGDLCISPDAFTRLLFGYRTLEELRDAWPDTAIRALRRPLLDALFPKLASYVWLPYMHCGHLEPLRLPAHGQP